MIESNSWKSLAYYSAKRIIARKYRAKSFLAEELLVDVVKDIGETMDFRTFGGTIRSLSNDGFIQRIGYAAAKTSNGSAKPEWIKVPHWGKK